MVGSCPLIASGLALVWAWPIIVFSGPRKCQGACSSTPPLSILRRYLLRRRREGQLETRVQELETIIQAKARRESQLGAGYAGWRNYPPVQRFERRSRRDRADRADRADRGPLRRVARWLPLQPKSSVVRPLPAVRLSARPRAGSTCPRLPKAVEMAPSSARASRSSPRIANIRCQFHDLTQIEGRFLGTGGQEPVNSTFLINRQWFMFSGRLTKPYEYFVSWAQGLDTITPLDVWLNVNYDIACNSRWAACSRLSLMNGSTSRPTP